MSYYNNIFQLFAKPSGFSPLQLANLAAWYKPEVGITLVSGQVDVWADQSGNGRNLTAATSGTRADVLSGNLAGYDIPTSKAAVDTILVTAANFPYSADITVFLVGLQKSTGDTAYGEFYDTRGETGGGSTIRRNFTNNTVQAYEKSATPGSIAVLNDVYYIMQLRTSGGITYFSVNGELETATTQGAGTTMAELFLFRRYNGASIGAKSIPELIYYTDSKTVAERDNLLQHLQNKYGIKNNYGTLLNGVTWSADVPSAISGNTYSATFDGTNDKVVPIRDIILDKNASSFSFWFKKTTIATDQVLFGDSTDADVYIRVENATTITLSSHEAPNTDSYKQFTVPTMTNETWYHCVITRNSGTTRVYLNTVQSTTNGIAMTTNLRINQFGMYYQGTLVFNGKLADVRQYHDVLSIQDIAALYAGTPTQAIALHHWKLNDNNGVVAKDSGIYDFDADKYMGAIRGGGDTITPAEEYATHELYIGMKQDTLM